MKKVLFAAGIVFVSAFSTFNAVAAEETIAQWKKIAEYEDGVHCVKSENGVVKSFVVVSSARISKVLGLVKGKNNAKKRAKLQAKAEIVKWMKSKVKSFESSSNESIIMIVGDGASISESGKSIEKTTEKYEEIAEGIVRGTSVVYSEIRSTGNEQEYVIILAWSAKNVKMARQAEAIMSGRTPLQPAAANTQQKAGGTDTNKTQSLPNKVIISDEAAEYLP